MTPKEELQALESHIRKAIEIMPPDQVKKMLADYIITLRLIEMSLNLWGQLHYSEIPVAVSEKLTELKALKKQFANQLQSQKLHIH